VLEFGTVMFWAVRNVRWAEYVARMDTMKFVHSFRPNAEEKRSFWTRGDVDRTDLNAGGSYDVDWMHLAADVGVS
jgi:hypothetical protein